VGQLVDALLTKTGLDDKFKQLMAKSKTSIEELQGKDTHVARYSQSLVLHDYVKRRTKVAKVRKARQEEYAMDVSPLPTSMFHAFIEEVVKSGLPHDVAQVVFLMTGMDQDSFDKEVEARINNIPSTQGADEDKHAFLKKAAGAPHLCSAFASAISSVCEKLYVAAQGQHDQRLKLKPKLYYLNCLTSWIDSDCAGEVWNQFVIAVEASHDNKAEDEAVILQEAVSLQELITEAFDEFDSDNWSVNEVSKESVGVHQEGHGSYNDQLDTGVGDDEESVFLMKNYKWNNAEKEGVRYHRLLVLMVHMWSKRFLLAQSNVNSKEDGENEEGTLPGANRVARARLFYIAGYLLRKIQNSVQFSLREKKAIQRLFDASPDLMIAAEDEFIGEGNGDLAAAAYEDMMSVDAQTMSVGGVSVQSEEQQQVAQREADEAEWLNVSDDYLLLEALKDQKTWTYGKLRIPSPAFFRFVTALESHTLSFLELHRIVAAKSLTGMTTLVNESLASTLLITNEMDTEIRTNGSPISRMFDRVVGCGEPSPDIFGYDIDTLIEKVRTFTCKLYVKLRVHRWCKRMAEKEKGSSGASLSFRAGV
jgi:hypothetical protein